MSKPGIKVVTLGAPGSGRTMLLAALLARSFRRFGTRPADIQNIRHDDRLDEFRGKWQYETERFDVTHHDGLPPWQVLPHIAERAAEGACGLVVVAADDGADGSLRTQLRVAALAGMRRLVVFITRTDAVADPAWLDIVEADVREALHDADMLGDEVTVIRGDAQQAYFRTGHEEVSGAIDALMAAMDAEFAPSDGPAVVALGERIRERFANFEDNSVTLDARIVCGRGLGEALEVWRDGVPTVVRVRMPRGFRPRLHFPDTGWEPLLRCAFPLAAAPGVLRVCRRFDLLAWETGDVAGHFSDSVLRPRVHRDWQAGTATIPTFLDAIRTVDGRPWEPTADVSQPHIVECYPWEPVPLTVGLPLMIAGGTGTRAQGVVVRLHE